MLPNYLSYAKQTSMCSGYDNGAQSPCPYRASILEGITHTCRTNDNDTWVYSGEYCLESLFQSEFLGKNLNKFKSEPWVYLRYIVPI